MSRSYRKTPITGITTIKSEKHDKQSANRATRARNRQRIGQGRAVLDRRNIRSAYSFGKDGKRWCGGLWRTKRDWAK